jgi:DNA-binding PadR family transcriptional regulator
MKEIVSKWLGKVGSSIPRGFSRYYILNLLKEQPMSGKEIINRASLQSSGKWKPSPGLIYPILGRLLQEGLIKEDGDGRYKITSKGVEMAADINSIGNIVKKQLDVMLKVGDTGKFMAQDLIDRASTIGAAISSNLDKMTTEERVKYKQVLSRELHKVETGKDADENIRYSDEKSIDVE